MEDNILKGSILHFRVHYQECVSQVTHWSLEVPQWLLDNPLVTRCLIGREVEATRPHFQCYIEFTKTMSTFRQQFKKKFPESDGNKDYSISDARKDATLISYVTKEGIYKKKGFTDEEINTIVKWVPKEEFKKQEKAKASGNTNRQIVEELKKKYPTRKWLYDSDSINIIVSYIQRFYGAGVKQISVFKVKDNAMGILNTLNPGILHNKLMNECFPDLFGNQFVEN